jgi:hypothetical protein
MSSDFVNLIKIGSTHLFSFVVNWLWENTARLALLFINIINIVNGTKYTVGFVQMRELAQAEPFDNRLNFL